MSTPDVTVLIPTYRRPEYLRTALQSVVDQTARARIREVRVSENGADERSRALCAEFADRLPIRFIMRTPSATIEHFRLLLSEPCESAYVAMLHDDDWWLPSHLADSFAAIDAHSAVGSYAAFFDTDSERAPLQHAAGTHGANLMYWFALGCPAPLRPWRVGHADSLVASLPGTPGRYSTMVMRTDVFQTGLEIVTTGNPFDTDRMICALYGRSGPIAYNPLPTACIRTHPAQDGLRFSAPDMIRRMSQTTLWIFEQAKNSRIDLIAELDERLARCPEPHRELAVRLCSYPWMRGLLAKHPRLPAPLAAAWNVLQPVAS